VKRLKACDTPRNLKMAAKTWTEMSVTSSVFTTKMDRQLARRAWPGENAVTSLTASLAARSSA